MSFWLCPSCGKKIAEKFKACPHCKALRELEIKSISSETKYLKAIIVLLISILLIGIVYALKQPESVQGKQVTPTYKPSTDTGSNSKSIPPSAIDAINALKKLEARTQVGIVYRDYPPALGEVKYAINLFNESSSSNDFPELLLLINKSFKAFYMAGEIWDYKIKATLEELIVKKSKFPRLFLEYPDAAKEVSDGGVTRTISDGETYINLDVAISFLFIQASKEIKKASTLIQR